MSNSSPRSPRHLRTCAPYEPEWVPFPKGFVRDPEVTPLLKGMMAVLCDFIDAATGYGAPTYRALADAVGLQKWRIRQIIRGLESLGYVDVAARPGSGLEYRLKGGPLRLVFEGGGVQHDHTPPVQHDHTPPVQHDHTPRYSTTTPPIMIDDFDLIPFLKTNYGLGAADAAAVAQSMPPERLRELIAFVDATPTIAHPGPYILAAARNELRKKARKPRREQLPLAPPAPLEQRRALAAVEDSATPPADASWLTDEERRMAAVRAAKAAAFPQFARQGAS